MNLEKQRVITDWVRLYTKYLYSWAYQKTSDHELAEDLVQETFLSAAEGYEAFREESHPKSWLVGILKNKIADYYRRAIRRNVVNIEKEFDASQFFNDQDRWHSDLAQHLWKADPDHLMDNSAFTKVLSGCIDDLPPVMNSCIRLKFIDEKKGKQICQELGLTHTNYWQLIHRAKLLLRDCLNKHWFSNSK